jgi:hypothetical protein
MDAGVDACTDGHVIVKISVESELDWGSQWRAASSVGEEVD